MIFLCRIYRESKLRNYYNSERQLRQNSTNPTEHFTNENETESSIMHSYGKYYMKLETSVNQTQHSSFPWEVYFDDMHHLEEKENKKGKAFMLFPNGFLMRAFDETFGDDLGQNADDIPGFIESVLYALPFRKEIR